MSLDISVVNSTYVTAVRTVINNGKTSVDQLNFTVSKNGAVWTTSEGEVLDWVGLDANNYAWGTVGKEASQGAVILSRTQNLSKSVIIAQLGLLAKEGYQITTTNYYTIPPGCINTKFE